MRTPDYDPTLLRELDTMDLPAVPLESAEWERVLSAARGQVNAARPHRASRWWLRWVRYTAAVAAACFVVLGSVNFANPALAESLPLVGNLFSWINRTEDTRLRSEQLNRYAQTVEQTAESVHSPYSLTLGQIYRDEDWMRLSLVLTVADDSLAGFDTIRADAGSSMPADAADASGALILQDGGVLSQEGVGWFTRQDDHTFVMGLNYPLFLYEEWDGPLSGEPVTMHLYGLVACNVEVLEEETHPWGGDYRHLEYRDETPLEGEYTLTFTIPEPGTEGIRTFIGPQVQNGVTLHSLTATPAAAKLDIQVPAGGSFQPKLTTEDGTLLKPERGEGQHIDEKDAGSDYRWIYYFDTVPENSHTVTVTVCNILDYDRPDGYEVLAEFTVPLT